MKTGFFEAEPGNRSSSRLGSFIVMVAALILAQEVIVFGFMNKDSIVGIAAAAGTLFLTIATPAMVYMFQQKKQEIKNKEK